MLQESYLFWRIKKGGVGLPIEGMPWKSAMPRWEIELPDEWIWKIIMGEYDGAAQTPGHGMNRITRRSDEAHMNG